MDNGISTRMLDYAYEKKITKTELGEKLGLSKGHMSNVQRVTPSGRVIKKFLEVFPEVDANWLIRGEEKSNHQKIAGDYNTQAGKNIINEPSALHTEIKYLKEKLHDKEEQIKLLKQLLNK